MNTETNEQPPFPPSNAAGAPDGVAGSTERTDLLRLNRVSRHFGALRAVDEVSFDMRAGELRAVIGQNGAGKTTFFNLISGFLPCTAGEVWFHGENIGKRTVVGRVARGIVRTFQITEVFPDLTVYESVRVAVEAATGVNRRPWVSPSERRRLDERVVEMMDAIDLTHKANRVVGELAHGDQRAVEI
ncbi:MAG TPA: ATP-binding cassette domain-containing protein, partial [Candidatus Limnocylindrales bacterium]|nr:ATP-binding cassette domain-containing protein [Candidatus Limnocylindrales bacterium]